ncbi:hypothetical protein R3P38DRAFT_2786925 [Favolaschia claudopus]|uniref:Uncharacterized protein n=1 Tax=Favolaschia claudopus TaxID=2862362 RepID=A0AAW0ATS3_9AGAR
MKWLRSASNQPEEQGDARRELLSKVATAYLKATGGGGFSAMAEIFQRWVNIWIRPVQLWGIFGMDLASKDQNFLLKHSIRTPIDLRPCSSPPAQVKALGVASNIWLKDYLDKQLPATEAHAVTAGMLHSADSWNIQLILLAHGCVNLSRISVNDYVDSDTELLLRSERPVLSRVLKAYWPETFVQHIASGNDRPGSASLRSAVPDGNRRHLEPSDRSNGLLQLHQWFGNVLIELALHEA